MSYIAPSRRAEGEHWPDHSYLLPSYIRLKDEAQPWLGTRSRNCPRARKSHRTSVLNCEKEKEVATLRDARTGGDMGLTGGCTWYEYLPEPMSITGPAGIAEKVSPDFQLAETVSIACPLSAGESVRHPHTAVNGFQQPMYHQPWASRKIKPSAVGPIAVCPAVLP